MARAGKTSTPVDMIRSLAVILIPLVVIIFFFTRHTSTPVHVVDWKPVLTQARSQAAFPIYAPDDLPQGWRVTKVSWVQKGNPDLNGTPVAADQWELGALNPKNIYVEIDQQDANAPDFVAASTRQGVPDGTSTVDGSRWNRLVSPDGRTRSLVRVDKSMTVLVSGDLGYSDLESFVGMLTGA